MRPFFVALLCALPIAAADAKPTTMAEFLMIIGPGIDPGESATICPSEAAVRRLMVVMAGKGSPAALSRRFDAAVRHERCREVSGPFKVVNAYEVQSVTFGFPGENWYAVKLRRGKGPVLDGLYGWAP